jgi:hypothetical protein
MKARLRHLDFMAMPRVPGKLNEPREHTMRLARRCSHHSKCSTLDLEPLEARTHLTAAPPVFSTSPTALIPAASLPPFVRQIVVADLDGDGRNDIVAIGAADAPTTLTGHDNHVWFFHALPDGSFASPKITPLGVRVQSIAAGHFSSSRAGADDLALVGTTDSDDSAGQFFLRVLRYKPETGALRVVARRSFAGTPYRFSMVVGNVTGNAADEIVFQYRSTNPTTAGTPVRLFIGIFGVAAGSPGSDDQIVLKTVIKEGTYAHSLINTSTELHLADLDGDGFQDVLFTPGPATRAWFRARAGTPERRITLAPSTLGVVPLRTLYGDIDGDHKADRILFSASFGINTGGTTVEYGNGLGSFGTNVSIPTNNIPGEATGYVSWSVGDATAVTDLDGDGQPDLFLMWGVSVQTGPVPTGSSSFETITTNSTTTLSPSAISPAPSAVGFTILADVNNDGLPDMVYFAHDGSGISVLLNIS